MTLVGTVDVSSTSSANNPEYIGSNPSAVAWNGTDVWVGGFNSSGSTGDAAVVKVSNALTAPAYGARFGVQPTTINQRGYSGLDVSGNLVVAAYDNGSATPEGITGWDLAGNQLWAKSARGSSGVGIDPGFGGLDAGVGCTTFGSGRRSLQDSATGADIYTSSNGMIINAGNGTLWRDMDFDSLIGDIYMRKSNEVVRCQRVGGNAVFNCQVLSNSQFAPFVNIQNLAYVRQGGDEVIFWNDRATTLGGQQFDLVVQAMTPQGLALTVDWGGFTPPGSSGAYDFSYDEASRTLAICDFNARAVYVFAVAVFQSYGTGCAGLGNVTPELKAGGDTRPGGAIALTASGVAPASIGLFALGSSPTAVPLPFPGNCPLHVDPVLGTFGLFLTPPGPVGSGSGSFTLPLPAVATGASLAAQCVVLENGSLNSVVTSNGVQVTVQ
ncbi:MAG: hypothetical protein VX044_10055 [Planctomycetota bacterium]|nr:hypothetical protein [Planctomycetota bacterium]